MAKPYNVMGIQELAKHVDEPINLIACSTFDCQHNSKQRFFAFCGSLHVLIEDGKCSSYEVAEDNAERGPYQPA